MGATRAMGNKRFEIPVWRGTEQVQEQGAADLISAQEQDGTTEDAQMSPGVLQRKRLVVPIQVKVLLTLEEAASYTGIGMNKLREISNRDDCNFVLWNGTRRLLKREKLLDFLNSAFSI